MASNITLYNPTWVSGLGPSSNLNGVQFTGSGSAGLVAPGPPIYLGDYASWVFAYRLRIDDLGQANKYIFGKGNGDHSGNDYAPLFGFSSPNHSFYSGGSGIVPFSAIADTNLHHYLWMYYLTSLMLWIDGSQVVYQSSQLTDAIDDSQTTFDLDDASGFGYANYTIRVDEEIMYVTGKSTNTLTVNRGVADTTAVAHSDAAAVDLIGKGMTIGNSQGAGDAYGLFLAGEDVSNANCICTLTDIRTHSDVISLANIATINSGGEAGSNLVGRWRFTEGGGTTVANSAGGVKYPRALLSFFK